MRYLSVLFYCCIFPFFIKSAFYQGKPRWPECLPESYYLAQSHVKEVVIPDEFLSTLEESLQKIRQRFPVLHYFSKPLMDRKLEIMSTTIPPAHKERFYAVLQTYGCKFTQEKYPQKRLFVSAPSKIGIKALAELLSNILNLKIKCTV